MKYISFLVLALMSCVDLENHNDDETSISHSLSATIPYKTVVGTEEDLLSLDIYYNKDIEEKKPVVVYVHGGGWSAGDKAHNIDDKVKMCEKLEYIFVSINYRLSPLPSQSTGDRIKYPTHNIDVADALKWIIENIANYGGDFEKIVLIGHSAGAHLVTLTGTNSKFMELTGYNLSYIKGVASIDTEAYDVRAKILEGNILYINAFGTDKQENLEASPIYNIQPNANSPRFFIAKRGNSERMLIANLFIQKLIENSIQVNQKDCSVYSHSGINDAIGVPGETVITPPLIDFFAQCFK